MYVCVFPDNLINIFSLLLQYQYVDLAAKQRAHFTPEINTPNMGHARKMKVFYSNVSLILCSHLMLLSLKPQPKIVCILFCLHYLL